MPAKNENKNVPTNVKEEKTSESSVVFHLIDTSAIDNVTAISNIAVDAKTQKYENKVSTNDDGDEEAQDFSADIQSIDDVATILNIVVKTGTDSRIKSKKTFTSNVSYADVNAAF